MMLTTLLLAAVIGYSSACDNEAPPDCATCEYNGNTGFIKHPLYCGVYFECNKKAHKDNQYTYRVRCCPKGLNFNVGHQTCDYDYASGCSGEHDCCPDFPIHSPDTYVCHYNPHESDDTKYLSIQGHEFNCSPGTVWDQGDCGCVWGDVHLPPPCDKIMFFQFEGVFDSYSCNNVVDGTAEGNPNLDYGVLNLDGNNDYLLISYFISYFAWNPIGKTFTMCLWINPSSDRADGTYGIFSTNCRNGGDSLLDLYVEGGSLKAVLGSSVVSDIPVTIGADVETKICVTFDSGDYEVFVNAVPQYSGSTSEYPINSHVPATVGFVEGFEPFKGYVDDFCFWTRVLSQEDIQKCYDDRVNPYDTAPAN